MANPNDVQRAKSGDKNLRDADLSGADLREAFLGRANLREAFLGGANCSWPTCAMPT
jgi:uncharacterized protein YjbI with pentapeptide repeats